MKTIHIVITMDCEPIRSAQGATQATSGPFSYAESESSIRAYARLAGERGFPVSFFIHPETALAHPEPFLEMEEKGACLGLHIHPYKIENTRFRNHFGALSASDQTDLLSESAVRWEQALGVRPRYFRPGTFSANDATGEVLARLGFRGGSLSCPGRMFPDLYAVWSGAPPDPHYLHSSFRLMPGDLDFVNVPLTVDFSRLETVDGRSFYRDLRPDYLEADYATLADNIVGQVLERDPVVPVVLLVTHNDHRFENPDDRGRKNLATVFQALATACEKHRVQPVGSTIAGICDLYRQRVDRETPDFVQGHASIQAGR